MCIAIAKPLLRTPPCRLAPCVQGMEAGAPEKGVLRVATWNIAAINNNPFEYWITHDDADYNMLGPDLGTVLGLGGWRVLHTTHGDV